MSDPAEDEDTGEAATPPAAKPKSKKKLLIIAGAAVLVLGGGGTAGVLMLGGGHGAAAEAAPAAPAHGAEGKDAFIDVPPMVVNLRSPDGAAHFLKVHVMLVPGPKGSAEALKNQLPQLLDAYQPFLRELRPEDLAGSAAVFRIKEALLVRSRDALGEGVVDDILIQDLVQQ